MGNLKAEKRLDRNGRLVTRHVRADDRARNNAGQIPAIGDPGAASVQRVVAAKLDTSIRESVQVRKVPFWKRGKLMRTMGEQTLATIAEHGRIRVGVYHSSLPVQLLQHCTNNGSFALLNDTAAYLHDYGTFPNEDTFEPAYYLAALQRVDVNDPSSPSPYGFAPYSQAGTEERAVQDKIMRAADLLGAPYVEIDHGIRNAGDLPYRRFRSGMLVQYMKENPDKIDDLVDTLSSRNLLVENDGDMQDVLDLMSVRDETANALDNGAL